MGLKRFAAIAIFGLLLTGCGGGGDGTPTTGGGAPPPGGGAPGTQSAGNAAAAVNFALGGIEFGMGAMSGEFEKPSLKPFKKAKATDLKASVAGFYKGLKAYRAKAISPLSDLDFLCPDGGSADSVVTEISFTETYTDCKELFDTDRDGIDDVEDYIDGTISFSITETGFTFSFNNLTERDTRISDGLLLEEITNNLTVTGTFGDAIGPCGPDEITIVINGTFSEYDDFDADGMPEFDESGSVTDFTTVVTVDQFDSDCEPEDGTVAVSGGLSLTDNIEANNSFTLNIPSGTLTFTFETVAGGENVTVNGSFSIVSSCFTGSLTVTTTEPLFFSESEFEDFCPTSGEIAVTGDLTGTITYTSTGGVEIDSGSDGTVDETYDDCEDAEACV